MTHFFSEMIKRLELNEVNLIQLAIFYQITSGNIYSNLMLKVGAHYLL